MIRIPTRLLPVLLISVYALTSRLPALFARRTTTYDGEWLAADEPGCDIRLSTNLDIRGRPGTLAAWLIAGLAKRCRKVESSGQVSGSVYEIH